MSRPVVPAFHETASLTVRVERSLYAEVSNHLIMVDYAAVGASPPTPWGWEVWSRFEPEEKELLEDLHCVLIHGLALQEYWLRHAAPDVSTGSGAVHLPLDQPLEGRQAPLLPTNTMAAQRESIPGDVAPAANWDEVLDAVATIPDDDLHRLIAESMISGIQYYRQAMASQSRIDALLPQEVDRLTIEDLLTDMFLLRSMAIANHLSWGVSEDRLDSILAMVLNPTDLRCGLYQLLTALRRHGSEEACQATRHRHNAWIQHAKGTIRNQGWTHATIAVEALTGRKPPIAEVNRVNLDEASELILIPCSYLGSSQRIATIGTSHVVMFEPSSALRIGTATDQPVLSEAVHLLRAITDGPAFSLVQSLAMGDEKYALQLADDAKIHQSTVSRHLAILERAGAVEVRPEGKAKYYRLDTERIRQALTTVGQALTPDSE